MANTSYSLAKAFAAIETQLINSMIRNMKRHRAEETDEGIQWSQWQAEQLKALEIYRKTNKKHFGERFEVLNGRLEELLRATNEQGMMEQEESILKAIRNGFTGYERTPQGISGEFFRTNERKLNALVKATTDDMQKAETAVLRMSNDQYRKIIFNAQVYANTGAGTYEQAVDMATKDMLSAGLNCVQYANGSRHTLSDYADMAIKTASKRAYLQGEGTKRQEWGEHLVIMAKRGNPCPKCLPFVGKILIDDVWSGGSRKDGKYPLMSTAIKAGLYHPRCKDSHTTYFPGITTADGSWTKEELDAVEKNSKEEARQQYAERQEEKYNRLANGSLDDENRELYSQKADAWKRASESSITSPVSREGTNDVDLEYIKTEPFRKKFTRLTGNTKVNDLIREYASAMLTHRNHTDGEDLYLLDTKGNLLLRKIEGTNSLGVSITDEELTAAMNTAQGDLIGMHNHPTNIPPTGSDFVTAGYRDYSFGIVVTHSGRVYKYSVGKVSFRANVIDARIDKYSNPPYNLSTEKAHIRALNEMQKEYGITWEELK